MNALTRTSPRRRAAVTIQGFKSVELPTQFALAILAARALPPQQLGTAAILISAQALYLAIASFGFDETLQRALARRDVPQDPETLVIAFRARIISASIAVVLGGAAFLVLLPDAGVAFAALFLGIGSAATIAANMYQQMALARYDVTQTAAASVLSWLLPSVLLAVGVIKTVDGYMAALATGAIARLGLAVIWQSGVQELHVSLRSVWRFRGRKLLDQARSHFSLAVYGVTDQVLSRHGDVFVAGIVGLSGAVIGAYALAFQITVACNQFLLLGIGALGLSWLSEDRGDLRATALQWRRLTTLAATLAVGPLALIVLMAPELVHAAVGHKYPGLPGVLRALAATQWAARVSGGGTNTTALMALGRMPYVGKSAVAGAVTNLGLDAVLAPVMGSYGLALGSAMAILLVGFANMTKLAAGFSVPVPGAGESGRPKLRQLAAQTPVAHLVFLSAVFAAAEISAAAIQAPLLRLGVGIAILTLWATLCMREVRA